MDDYLDKEHADIDRVRGNLVSSIQFLQFLINKKYFSPCDVIDAEQTITKMSCRVSDMRRPTIETDGDVFLISSDDEEDVETINIAENMINGEGNTEKKETETTTPEGLVGSKEELQGKEITHTFDKDNIWEDPLGKLFRKWLTDTPNFVPHRTAHQHVFQAFTVWRKVAPDNTVEELLQPEAMNTWFMKTIDEMAPGTVLSYIGSIIRLLEFLMDTRYIDDEARARRSINQLQKLRKHVSKRRGRRASVIQTREIRE